MKTDQRNKTKHLDVHETYTEADSAFTLCDDATKGLKQMADGVNVDIPGGYYHKYADTSHFSLKNNYANFCGGPMSGIEKARIITNGCIQAMTGVVGAADISRKTENLAAAGKTDFKDMPDEILKAVHKKISDTKDLALAKTTCEDVEVSDDLLRYAEQIDKYATVQLESLQNVYLFEARTLNIQMTTLFIIINSIITFLLFY